MIDFILPYLIGVAFFWYTAYEDRQYDDDRRKRGARIFFLAPLWPLVSLVLLTLPYFFVLGMIEVFSSIKRMWRDAEWRSLWRQTSTS